METGTGEGEDLIVDRESTLEYDVAWLEYVIEKEGGGTGECDCSWSQASGFRFGLRGVLRISCMEGPGTGGGHSGNWQVWSWDLLLPWVVYA